MKLHTSLVAAFGFCSLTAARQDEQVVLYDSAISEPDVMSVAIIGTIYTTSHVVPN